MNEQEAAYYRGMARQMAPAILDLFHHFATVHNLDPYRCYLVARFKSETDTDKPENQILELKSLDSDAVESTNEFIDAEKEKLAQHESEYKFLTEVLPLFANDIREEAAHLGVPVTKVFILLTVIRPPVKVENYAVALPAHGSSYLRIQFKCSGRPDWNKILLDGKV